MASAADRLLPSLEESGRLVRAIPTAQRVILPNSGHTALLESGIDLAAIMDRTGFLPEVCHLPSALAYLLHSSMTCEEPPWPALSGTCQLTNVLEEVGCCKLRSKHCCAVAAGSVAKQRAASNRLQ